MTEVSRTYARSDEKQFVFLFEDERGFLIVETVELWEEPRTGAEDGSYFCYPTVIGNERYPTVEAASAEIRDRYPWTA